MDELGAALGVSERQLRRRFADAVGYGPKTLARVLRFQRFLALGRRPAATWRAWRCGAGYADQAHLTRETPPARRAHARASSSRPAPPDARRASVSVSVQAVAARVEAAYRPA